MALNSIDYLIYRELWKAKVIPPFPDVLELGEANWYGDVKIDQLVADIKECANPDCRLELLRQLERLFAQPPSDRMYFDIAKVFYKTFLDYRSISAIDLHGTEAALRYDLNAPVPLAGQYQIVANTGTAEHVFNVCQFFKTVHERTVPGGLMIHAFPFTGWLDHGFYNFNPTFAADLAATNQYAVLLWVYGELRPPRAVQLRDLEQVHEMERRGELGTNSLQYLVLRKPQEEKPFKMPMQGFYARKISDQVARDWVQMR